MKSENFTLTEEARIKVNNEFCYTFQIASKKREKVYSLLK